MNKKNLPLIIVGVVIILGLITFFVMSNKSSKTASTQTSEMPTTQVIPTVDSSVKITMTYADASKHDLQLEVKHFPAGTESFEYEISYNTKSRGMQGIPTDEPINVKGKDSYTKKFFIGTESSGAKTYDVIDGPVNVKLKFNGSYGAKSFEKDFDVNQ